MSAQILNVPAPDGTTQGSMIGGSKPLHRFLKGQPKITGIIILIIGISFINFSVAVAFSYTDVKPFLLPEMFLGTLLLITGILFIVAGHNTTKKTVTASLALSIVSILVTSWFFLRAVGDVNFYFVYDHYDYIHMDHNDTAPSMRPDNRMMEASLHLLFMFYSLAALIVFIVMSALAGAALRSTRSQAIVTMTVAEPETPHE